MVEQSLKCIYSELPQLVKVAVILHAREGEKGKKKLGTFMYVPSKKSSKADLLYSTTYLPR